VAFGFEPFTIQCAIGAGTILGGGLLVVVHDQLLDRREKQADRRERRNALTEALDDNEVDKLEQRWQIAREERKKAEKEAEREKRKLDREKFHNDATETEPTLVSGADSELQHRHDGDAVEME